MRNKKRPQKIKGIGITENKLSALIRDLTKVGSIPKSEARRRILEFANLMQKSDNIMQSDPWIEEFDEKFVEKTVGGASLMADFRDGEVIYADDVKEFISQLLENRFITFEEIDSFIKSWTIETPERSNPKENALYYLWVSMKQKIEAEAENSRRKLREAIEKEYKPTDIVMFHQENEKLYAIIELPKKDCSVFIRELIKG